MNKAFSLVELLVVVVVIVILLALLLPMFERGRERASVTKCAANLKQLGGGILAYGSDNSGAIPPVSERVEDNLDRNERAGFFRNDEQSANTFYYYNLGFLWRDKQITGNGDNFFCPSQADQKYKLETYSDPAFPPAGMQDKDVYLPYYYNPITRVANGVRVPLFERVSELGGHPSPPAGEEWKRTAILIMDHAHSLENVSHIGSSRGFNVAFGDVSVTFQDDPKLIEILKNDDVDDGGNENIPTTSSVGEYEDILKLLTGQP